MRQRNIPGYLTEQYNQDGAVVYYGNVNGKPVAMGFRSPRQIKPSFYNSFKDTNIREQKVQSWLEMLKKESDKKAERKAAIKAFVNPFKVGDIFYNSWGYDQTNIDFYKVLEVKKRSVVIRQVVTKKVRYTTDMSADVVADPDNWKERSTPQIKVVKFYPNGEAYLTMEHGSMSLWDGKPRNETYYG